MDKSFAFMDAQQQVTLGHPVFDEINRRPTATFANRKLDDAASSNNRDVISKISSNSGLFFFFDGSEASMAQMGVLDMLVRNHEFDIVKISVAPIPQALQEQGIRIDNGHGAQMGVTTVPAIVLVRPDGVFDIISQAPVSLNDLKKRLLVGAKRLAVISEDEFNSTRPINNINLNLADSQPKAIQPSTNNLPIPAKDIVNAFSGGQTR
jgi:conjugal transfer pilus assembly protein TraF